MTGKKQNGTSFGYKTCSLFCKMFGTVPWALLGSGAGVLIYQIYLWQQTKSWSPMRASVLLKRIVPAGLLHGLADDPLGLKQSVFAVLNSSLAGFLLTCSVLLFAIFILVVTWLDSFWHHSAKNEAENPHLPLGYTG